MQFYPPSEDDREIYLHADFNLKRDIFWTRGMFGIVLTNAEPKTYVPEPSSGRVPQFILIVNPDDGFEDNPEIFHERYQRDMSILSQLQRRSRTRTAQEVAAHSLSMTAQWYRSDLPSFFNL